MLDQNHDLVEKYKSLVTVIQQNMGTLKYSVDTEIIMDYLEPFDGSNSPMKNKDKPDDTPTKQQSTAGQREVNPSTSGPKKRLSGDFGGPLSRRTENNLSAKDLRQKIASPTEDKTSKASIRLSHSLTRKSHKNSSVKDIKASKKQ